MSSPLSNTQGQSSPLSMYRSSASQTRKTMHLKMSTFSSSKRWIAFFFFFSLQDVLNYLVKHMSKIGQLFMLQGLIYKAHVHSDPCIWVCIKWAANLRFQRHKVCVQTNELINEKWTILDSYQSNFAHVNVLTYLFSGKQFYLENLLKLFIIHYLLKV